MNTLASRSQLRGSLLRWSLLCVPGVVLLGFLSGQLGDSSSAWFQSLEKPALSPPPATFGIVWSVLYAVMGFALALVCAAWGARYRGLAITLFAIQLLLNLAWTPLFFGLHQIYYAQLLLYALCAVLLATVAAFWRVRRLAGALLLPYLAWVLFATVLNYQFLRLNPEADGREVPDGPAVRIDL